MSAPGQLIELAKRKQLMVLQADLHRATLQAEAERFRERFGWLAQAREKTHSPNPWLGLATAVAGGLLAATQWRKLARWIPIAFAAWRWWQRLNPHRKNFDEDRRLSAPSSKHHIRIEKGISYGKKDQTSG